MAKRFLHGALGLLCLAAAYHLGSGSAEGQLPKTSQPVSIVDIATPISRPLPVTVVPYQGTCAYHLIHYTPVVRGASRALPFDFDAAFASEGANGFEFVARSKTAPVKGSWSS